MLVLTRKPGQSLVIGGLNGVSPLVAITVLEIQEGRVRLGFTASSAIPIQRKEVWLRLQPPGMDPIAFLDDRKAVASVSVAT